ncbi:condensation domain-containing protein [Plantactinospora siamensis]|uniref:Condensation domain-containing protein n=1 Tax=Plantactinospora siamensis TaxID=555372 RepID=A0ABV6P4F8_9ACTN
MSRVPASVAQRLLWVLEQFRGAHGSANCPIVLRLRGRLDVDRLTDALTALTARHASLRTTFTGRGARLTQLVHDPGPVRLHHRDLDPADPARALHAAVADEVSRPVDAERWPTRITLFRLADDDHGLCVNLHHAVTDGASCGLIVRDLQALAGGGPPLPAVRWQYPEFCRWQAGWLASPESDEDRAYWAGHLAGARVPRLPLRPAPAGAPWASASSTGTIDAATVAALTDLARRHRTTLASATLAVYYLVLRAHTGDDDLAVASFLANRTRPELRHTVGLLANMAVLRTRLGDRDGFAEVLRRTHRTAMDAFVHQRLPYQLLRGDTLAEPGRRPDDVMFQLVPQLPGGLRVAGAEAEIVVVNQLGSRFECEFQLYPQHGALRAVLCYNRTRLDDALAARLVGDYVATAAAVARGDGHPVPS